MNLVWTNIPLLASSLRRLIVSQTLVGSTQACTNTLGEPTPLLQKAKAL